MNIASITQGLNTGALQQQLGGVTGGKIPLNLGDKNLLQNLNANNPALMQKANGLVSEFKNIPQLNGLGSESRINPNFGVGGIGKAHGVVGPSRTSFGNVLSQAIHHVDQKQKIAANEATNVLIGKSDNLHHAVLSMKESKLAFDLLVETRNACIEGIQELTRLQIG